MKKSRPVIQHGMKQNQSLTTSQRYWLLALTPVLIFIFYLPAIKGELIGFDDTAYLKEFEFIHGLSFSKLMEMFSTKVMGTYIPLTMLSYAIDISLGGMNTTWMHLENLLWHTLNTWILLQLFRQWKFSFGLSCFLAMIFALHPMHVESVAWIAGRKDVLFTCFFFLSIWFYQRNKNYSDTVISILFCAASLLSKPQAVTLPFVLLLLHLWKHGLPDQKNWYKLAPYFLLAGAIGLLTLSGSGSQAYYFQREYTLADRVVFSCIALTHYFYKFFIPSPLSTLYSFPEPGSASYSIQLMLSLVLLGGGGYYLYKFQNSTKEIRVGILFFLINLIFVLHLFALNSSLIYERFSYVAYTGILIACGHVYRQMKTNKSLLLGIAFTWLFLLSWQTYIKASAWKNSISLWESVLKSNPDSEIALNNRASYYLDRKNGERALKDLRHAAKLAPDYPEVLNNLTAAYLLIDRPDSAWIRSCEALAHLPDFYEAYINKSKAALALYNRNPNAQFWIDSAIVASDRAIALDSSKLPGFVTRGLIFAASGNFMKAIQDLDQVLVASPRDTLVLRNTGLAYVKARQPEKAVPYFLRLYSVTNDSSCFITLSDGYNDEGIRNAMAGNLTAAMDYYKKALQVYPTNVSALFNMGLVYSLNGNKQMARIYWERILIINPKHEAALAGLKTR